MVNGKWLGQFIDNTAYIVYTVCMEPIQYTIRNIPKPVDQVIRKRARATGKSFNQTVVDMLSLYIFNSTQPDAGSLDWLYGSMSLDEGFESAISDQSKVEEDMWK